MSTLPTYQVGLIGDIHMHWRVNSLYMDLYHTNNCCSLKDLSSVGAFTVRSMPSSTPGLGHFSTEKVSLGLSI